MTQQTNQEKTPSLQEWRALYKAAQKLKTLAPWQWLEEWQLFGLQNPETGDLGYVSVMGMLGEHYAMSLYLGADGLDGFWHMQEAAHMYGSFPPELALSTPQLQVSFEDRDMLSRQDLAVIKKLQLKFRGRQAWPLFRSFRPGYVPWHFTAAEARFLTQAIEQLLLVAPQIEEDPTFLPDVDDENYLMRLPHQEGERWVWQDEIQPAPDVPEMALDIYMHKEVITYLQQLETSEHELEVDFFWTPGQVQESPKERPFFMYILLLVDHHNGFIVGSQALPPQPTYEEMLTQVPAELMQLLVHAKMRPRQLHVYPNWMQRLAPIIAEQIGISFTVRDWLPNLEEAKKALMQRIALM